MPMTVCHERTDSNGGAELRKRWGKVPRSRPSGAGFKPPQAATVKSRGGVVSRRRAGVVLCERWRHRGRLAGGDCHELL